MVVFPQQMWDEVEKKGLRDDDRQIFLFPYNKALLKFGFEGRLSMVKLESIEKDRNQKG